MTLAVPALSGGAPNTTCLPPTSGHVESRLAGKAERVGTGKPDSKVSLSGKVLVSGAFDLGAATLTVASLLEEADGTELVQGSGGARLLPLSLVARPGSKSTGAIFETLSGARPHVRAEVKQRDPKKSELEVSLTVEFATIPRLPRGCSPEKGSRVPLRTLLSLAPANRESVEVASLLSWRCGKNDLKTP
jgi:hypothetical protein